MTSPPVGSRSSSREGLRCRPHPVDHHLEWTQLVCSRCYLQPIQWVERSQNNPRRTVSHNGSLQLRRRHTFQNTRPQFTRHQQVSKLHATLLNLQLRVGGISRNESANAFLLGGTCCWSGGHLRDRSENELTDEEVRVRRVEDGNHQIQYFSISYL